MRWERHSTACTGPELMRRLSRLSKAGCWRPSNSSRIRPNSRGSGKLLRREEGSSHTDGTFAVPHGVRLDVRTPTGEPEPNRGSISDRAIILSLVADYHGPSSTYREGLQWRWSVPFV